MTITEQIIKRLEKLEISTEEISDILGKTGAIKGMCPINSGIYLVGEIQYVCAYNNSNWPVHEQIRELHEGKICFVDTCFVDDYAIFGELVSNFIIKNKKAKGIIVNGLIRDINGIKKNAFPVWSKGITPVGCFNVQVNLNPEIRRHIETNRLFYEGSIAVCDDSGVVIIPKNKINEDFINKIDFMRKQEDIWFDCIVNKQWTTYDTVCIKKYLENSK